MLVPWVEVVAGYFSGADGPGKYRPEQQLGMGAMARTRFFELTSGCFAQQLPGPYDFIPRLHRG